MQLGGIGAVFVMLVSVAALVGVVVPAMAFDHPETNSNKYVAPSKDRVFNQQPLSLPAQIDKKTTIPNSSTVSLSEFIDIALQNSPATEKAWATAKAAVANWAVARSSYYPTVSGNLTGDAGKIPVSLGGSSFFNESSSLNYLLLDFGARRSQSMAAKDGLIAANWNHNQAIQDILRDVPKAYYTLIGNKSLAKAEEENKRDAQTSLTSAEERERNGVATIADILQARSAFEQANYNLASALGSVDISRGQLATTAGLPANTGFDVISDIKTLPLKTMSDDIDKLIDKAKTERADLNAAIASVRQKEEQLKNAKTLPFPKITGTGNQSWMENRSRVTSNAYYGGIGIQIPIFDGFSMRNQLKVAKANLEASRADLKSKQEAVIQEVWTAHYNFATAKKQYEFAKAALDSSLQSFAVSLGRYKEGAATIVELMNTQGQLALSRSQYVGARMNVLLSYADLVHAVGAGLSTELPSEEKMPNVEEDKQ